MNTASLVLDLDRHPPIAIVDGPQLDGRARRVVFDCVLEQRVQRRTQAIDVDDQATLRQRAQTPRVVGTFGDLYLAVAILLDLVLGTLVWRLWRDGTPGRASALFHWSLLYLALLFVAVAAGAAIG